MDYQEARHWLEGKRSMCNSIPQDPFKTWQVRSAQADAACLEQAYWIVRAHKEGLVPYDKGNKPPRGTDMALIDPPRKSTVVWERMDTAPRDRKIRLLYQVGLTYTGKWSNEAMLWIVDDLTKDTAWHQRNLPQAWCELKDFK